MGFWNQLIRSVKDTGKNAWNGIFGKKRNKMAEFVTVPGSWGKTLKQSKPLVKIKYKRRLPGLRIFNRGLAAILLIINFAFSQFLLGSIGSQAQPMFILFILNSYIMIYCLWKTRNKKE
jgi:hypothetical protein